MPGAGLAGQSIVLGSGACASGVPPYGFGGEDSWQLVGAGAGRLYCRGGPGGRRLMRVAVCRGRDQRTV